MRLSRFRIFPSILRVMIFALFTAGAVFAQEKNAHIVEIRDFNFHPAELIIHEGDTVRWINKMPYGHWVISGADMKHDSRFFSPLLLENHTFTATFEDAVMQDYYCPIHSMQGTVTVLPRKDRKGEPAAEAKEEDKPKPSRRRVRD